ncbi:hypothetical protein TNCV_4193051 [Trichonephila clavipes]|nr:hypothetical protein TNCV_4193051 [Trichonephila clavipes]
MGSTLNSRRATSLLVRLVKEQEKWETLDYPQDVLPQNWSETTEQNLTVTYMMLKVETNYMRKNLAFHHDEFRGP